jgi:HD-GYP domain-containing protein (c-di-GMP phosphodiesterase class II)
MVVAFLLAAFLIGYTLSQSNPPTPDAETHNQNDIEEVEAKSKEQASIPHFVDPQPAASLANISNGLATQNANLQKERDAAAIRKIKKDMEAAALIAEKRALQLEEDKQEAQTAYTVRLQRDKRERACMKQKAAMKLKQGNVIAAITSPAMGPQTRKQGNWGSMGGRGAPRSVVMADGSVRTSSGPGGFGYDYSNTCAIGVDCAGDKPPMKDSTGFKDEAIKQAIDQAQNTAATIARTMALAKQKVLEEAAKHKELNAGLESRQTPKNANHTTVP